MQNLVCDVVFHFVVQGILQVTESPLLNLEPFKIFKDLVAQCKCLSRAEEFDSLLVLTSR